MTLSVNAIWEPFCVYQTDVKKNPYITSTIDVESKINWWKNDRHVGQYL